MATKPKKSVSQILEGLSEEHRRMVAEGMATLHRFAVEPALKHGRPKYTSGRTVEAIKHAKADRGR
ncbi:MAG: hypothetical protein WDO13_04840 [Verrucomicrobiota bacterium]